MITCKLLPLTRLKEGFTNFIALAAQETARYLSMKGAHIVHMDIVNIHGRPCACLHEPCWVEGSQRHRQYIITTLEKHCSGSSLRSMSCCGPLLEDVQIPVTVKCGYKLHLHHLAEAFCYSGLLKVLLEHVKAHIRNAPHLSLCLVLPHQVEMVGQRQWSLHPQTSARYT